MKIEKFIQIIPKTDIKKIDNNYYIHLVKCPRCNSYKYPSYFNLFKTCRKCLNKLKNKRISKMTEKKKLKNIILI